MAELKIGCPVIYRREGHDHRGRTGRDDLAAFPAEAEDNPLRRVELKIGAGRTVRTVRVEPKPAFLGDDPVGAFRAASARTMAAWRTDGALDGMVTTPAEMPAIAALGVNVIDTGTHCWDLAEAIGADHGLSDETIAVIDHWNRQVVSGDVRAGAASAKSLKPDRKPD